MSGDQQAPSFGDPNREPPTPKQTPTSSIFPSPVFETPRNNHDRFDQSPGGWTPRFAEEYSVFNTTPGNLKGTQGPFVDFAPLTPYLPQHPDPAGHKRPFSAEGIAAEIATHVNYFSPNPNLPLPPVQPSQRLQSSPSQAVTQVRQSTEKEISQQPNSRERSSKKRRRSAVVEESPEDEQGQTVTPPPSARKSQRQLAPKLDINAMQNDQGFSQQDFINGAAQQQHNMGSFVTTPSDMFGYPLSAGPLSAPATGQSFGNQRTFWDPDPNMAGMDIDYLGNAGSDVFQQPTSATMESLDWAEASQMFQQAGGISQSQPNQENMQGPPSGERALPSKAVMPRLDSAADSQSMFTGTYPNPVDNPFGIVGNAGGVNPGLLFSQPPPSSSLTSEAFNQAVLPPSSAPPAPQSTQLQQQQSAAQPQPRANPAQRGELRRSLSSKELGPSRRVDRSFVSSPTKSSARPGLSRSFSENRGKKPVGRASLPALAPAPRPQTGVGSNRPVISQAGRPSGRTSPLKSDHHHRLSSLSSIPETASNVPRTRTQAKFTIDANGRARVETTVFVEDDLPPPLSVRKRNMSQPVLREHQQWQSSESDDDTSSVDDDPIIIPSRNTSFVLPDPIKATRKNPLHGSQRSISERSTASYVTFGGQSFQDDPDSEAETVMNEMTPTGGRVGDAASELKKLRESRQRQHQHQQLPSPTKHSKRYVSAGGAPIADFAGNYARYAAISPASMTESSLPTPASSASQGIRCICNRHEVDRDGDGFMVQCESCEMWLHGRCVNISKRTVPSVYICLFCANTPNMRGGRIRDNGRVSMGSAGAQMPNSALSPLAHKSFKSFR